MIGAGRGHADPRVVLDGRASIATIAAGRRVTARGPRDALGPSLR